MFELIDTIEVELIDWVDVSRGRDCYKLRLRTPKTELVAVEVVPIPDIVKHDGFKFIIQNPKTLKGLILLKPENVITSGDSMDIFGTVTSLSDTHVTIDDGLGPVSYLRQGSFTLNEQGCYRVSKVNGELVAHNIALVE